LSPAKPITLYEWILGQFTVEGRAEFVDSLAPSFERLIEPGARALDLCCGAGPFSFLFERLGAEVTGIDNAPFMIELATREAAGRGSTVKFIQADVLEYDLEPEHYDLVALLGNTLSDFPLDAAALLAQKCTASLRRSGRFAVHYIDGVYGWIHGEYQKEEVEQQEPIVITRRFRQYRAEDMAIVETYRNETTQEEYDYTSYLYTAPVVRMIVGGLLELEQVIRLSQRSFLDVFRKP